MEQNNSKKDRSNQSSEAVFSEPGRNLSKPSCSSGKPEVKPSGNPDGLAPEKACTLKGFNKNDFIGLTLDETYSKMVKLLRDNGVPVNTTPSHEGLSVMFNPPQSWIDAHRASEAEKAQRRKDLQKPEKENDPEDK